MSHVMMYWGWESSVKRVASTILIRSISSISHEVSLSRSCLPCPTWFPRNQHTKQILGRQVASQKCNWFETKIYSSKIIDEWYTRWSWFDHLLLECTFGLLIRITLRHEFTLIYSSATFISNPEKNIPSRGRGNHSTQVHIQSTRYIEVSWPTVHAMFTTVSPKWHGVH